MRAAVHLFAELGFDQTSLQMVADAAGVPVAVARREFGDKTQLYMAAFRAVAINEQSVAEKISANFTYDRTGLYHLVDEVLEYALDNPDATALWMQRTMSDAADITEIEKMYFSPNFQNGRRLVARVIREDIDAEFALWTIMWCVRAFVRGGILDEQGQRVGKDDPRTMIRFRTYLHSLVDLFTTPSLRHT
ncbi:TetR/AcrR family transcriptional regulator [Actinocorallia herbida]|uniref:TetR/AcrR family transcriptional regulator n=1 Tax=Actinocorallia herbida TaxID=58109 RepID=UPI0014769D12|nr:TetR/AcrR family transcriptional regulator [Actinocorallia herbida]